MTGDRKGRLGAAIVWVAFLLGVAAVLFLSPGEEGLRSALAALGPFAPIAYALGEIVQVIIIPIPGQPFEVAGGWVLGFAGGSLVGTAGAFAGSMISFHIARRFGRAWVEGRTAGGVRSRVAEGLHGGQRVEWIVFWLMMIPNFPRDPLCFVAGITGMSTGSFALIALLGRPVGLVPWVALGADGAAAGAAWQLAMIAVAATIWIAVRIAPRLLGGASEVPEPEPKLET